VAFIPILIAIFFIFVLPSLNRQKKALEEAKRQAQMQAPNFSPPAPRPIQQVRPAPPSLGAHTDEGLGTHEHYEGEKASALRFTEGAGAERLSLSPEGAYAIKTRARGAAAISPEELARAVLLTEILGKPKARR
jgi:hypothetical protein